MSQLTCRRCNGEVVLKSRPRLVIVGLVMLAAAGLGWVIPWFQIPALILALTGVYLLIWATLGRGRWCRGCKRFDGV